MEKPPEYDLTPYALDTTQTRYVWHYTDAAGLVGIVTGHVLWASSPYALNDSREIVYGGERMLEVYRKRQRPDWSHKSDDVIRELGLNRWHEMYVLCASRDGDSLNQWQGYAGRQGYAIELDTSGGLTAGATDKHFAPGWYDVTYDEEEQIARIDSVFDQLSRIKPTPDSIALIRATTRFTNPLAACLKHPGFRAEEEVRYVTAGPDEPRFRPGRHGVIPYVELRGVDDRLPIRSVRCGPSGLPSNEGVEESVRALLRPHYSDVSIDSSNIPFR